MRRRSASLWLVSLALLGLLAGSGLARPPAAAAGSRAAGSGSASASDPVTLTTPANGGLIIDAQPTFAGAAQNAPAASGQVTVDVYAGTSAGALPVEVLSADVHSGAYTVTAVGLPDGTYTATASETATSSGLATSAPVTFQIFSAPPQVTLTAPPAPITTPAPTLTGTASTQPGAGQSVDIILWSGSGTDSTPLAMLPGTVAADGSFSVQVRPGLAVGTYTAVAGQQLASGPNFSRPVTFAITTAHAVLRLTTPRPGASEPQSAVRFSGSAGAAYGDSPHVTVTLYRGRRAAGRPIGRAVVARTATSWSLRWRRTLALGIYTVAIGQANVVNRVTRVTRTFRVAAPASLIGPPGITAAGRVSATVSCLPEAGSCHGDVLILTQAPFTPQYGGPHGRLSLLFAHFSLPAGARETLTAQLSAPVRRVLVRARQFSLVDTVIYPLGSRLAELTRTTARVSVG
ncbi:hypothetical protein [Conexibacter sp. DBS9H8]|uniref:hypothetical protein n=1 Tax=Conexibacter sp. DBS9H8 TaxID=2937801 RepID=UPI00200C2290|nr:hypothetical protein [Conexibacter sp. DBS9H8]